ncbi:MAG: tyrosine recombinase [Candidatus Scalindua sp.]
MKNFKISIFLFFRIYSDFYFTITSQSKSFKCPSYPQFQIALIIMGEITNVSGNGNGRNSVESLIDDFLNYKLVERDVSMNTISTYRTCLNKISDYFSLRGIDILTLERSSMIELMAYMRGKGLSTNTVYLRLVALREFLRYLIIEGVIDKFPYFEYPKLEKKIPRYLTYEEIDKLFNAPLGIKQKMILEILYATGMRISELVNLKIRNIDFDRRFVKCLGKGEKERLVPIGSKALEAIQVYLKEVRPTLIKDEKIDNLLLTRTGKVYKRENLWESVRNSARVAKLERDIKPHDLRHTFATHLLDNEADIRCIQEMLGHSSLNTTQVYTHVSIKRLKYVHEKYHPRPLMEAGTKDKPRRGIHES